MEDAIALNQQPDKRAERAISGILRPMTQRQEAQSALNAGTVVAIRGSVVDAQFPQSLPKLYQRLVADGPNGPIVIEVVAHLDG